MILTPAGLSLLSRESRNVALIPAAVDQIWLHVAYQPAATKQISAEGDNEGQWKQAICGIRIAKIPISQRPLVSHVRDIHSVSNEAGENRFRRIHRKQVWVNADKDPDEKNKCKDKSWRTQRNQKC